MWINERGPGRGISVEVWGPGVDAGLIEVLSVEVQQGPNTIGLDIASHVASSGECVLVADAPRLEVYAAADWNASATQAEDIGRSMLTTRIVFRTAG